MRLIRTFSRTRLLYLQISTTPRLYTFSLLPSTRECTSSGYKMFESKVNYLKPFYEIVDDYIDYAKTDLEQGRNKIRIVGRL